MTGELHPDIAPLGFLAGIWRGEGRGCYPTIEPFTYREEARFRAPPGRPFLAYSQTTRDALDGRPLHGESGYWRLREGRWVELVLAHATGLVDLEVGELDGRRIGLSTHVLAWAPSALPVEALERVVEVRGDELTYRLSMAYGEIPMTEHLQAVLHRVGDP